MSITLMDTAMGTETATGSVATTSGDQVSGAIAASDAATDGEVAISRLTVMPVRQLSMWPPMTFRGWLKGTCGAPKRRTVVAPMLARIIVRVEPPSTI